MTQTVLITVVAPEGQADLAAPGDTPVRDLLPTFLELVGAAGADGAWEVGPPGRAALATHRTLVDCGIADGSVLQLRAVGVPSAPADAGPTAGEGTRLPEAEGSTPRSRTQEVLPERLSGVRRVKLASGAALRAPETALERSVPGRPADPKNLTRVRPPTPMERVRTSWRSTDYVRRLDDAIRAPRLGRCATIAVVSPKGGVGKTTVTALLGSLLSSLRRDRAVAVDTNPDYGSLGRTLAPDHRVFVDDLLDILEHPELTSSQLDANLGRAADGLMVLPAPTDPARMARLDRNAYARVIERLQSMSGLLVLDCGTGLQEPAAQAAILAADQIVLISDAEPSTASLVAEAATLLERAGPPLTLVVNKLPKGNSRLDIEAFEREVPRARGLVTVPSDPEGAALVSSGRYSWEDAPATWERPLRELAAVLVADWPTLGITA